MSKDKDTEIRSKYDDYSVEELKSALNAIFDSTDEFSDSQVEEMDKIMAVLTKKNPLPHRYTAEESWKIFQETYSEELSRIGIRNTEEVMEIKMEAPSVEAPDVVVVKSVEESAPVRKGRCRKLLHTALIAAAVVAAMVIITVSAAAAGINIWKWVQVRGEGTVSFATEDALSKNVPAALKQAGVEAPLFPTWLPDGFLLFEQHIRLDEPIHTNSIYINADKVLSIIIRSIDDDYSSQIEIDKDSPKEYCSNGIIHYIIPNYELLTAYWLNDGYLVTVSGSVNIEEIEHIIDSVYVEV